MKAWKVGASLDGLGFRPFDKGHITLIQRKSNRFRVFGLVRVTIFGVARDGMVCIIPSNGNYHVAFCLFKGI